MSTLTTIIKSKSGIKFEGYTIILGNKIVFIKKMNSHFFFL